MAGVYKIESIIKPDRIYIGSTSNLYGRRAVHLHRLRNGTHHSKKLQRHFNKYGEADLIFCTLIECDVKELILEEQRRIDLYKPYFNVCRTAGSTLGLKPSVASNEKRRTAFANRVYTKDQMEKFSSFAGKSHTEETKLKISLGNKNKRLSEETKAKISSSKKGKSINIGHFVSDETRRKISESNIGKKAWNKGMAAWNKGIKGVYSDETKAKMSEARKRWHSEQKREIAN